MPRAHRLFQINKSFQGNFDHFIAFPAQPEQVFFWSITKYKQACRRLYE